MLAIATFGAAVLLFHTPTKYGSDRLRRIFIDHWESWWDCRKEEIPSDQRAYVQKTVEKMMGGRNVEKTYLYKGHALALQGDAQGAIDAYEQAIRLNENFYPAQWDLDSITDG